VQRLDTTLADLFPPLAEGADQYTGDRSAGLHVSEVVYSLVSKLFPARYPGKEGDGTERWGSGAHLGRQLVGLAFEDALGDRLADRYSRLYNPHVLRPGEAEREGIIGTADLLDPVPTATTTALGAIEEWKATWMSSRDADPTASPKFVYWVWQGKTYCAIWGIPTLRIRALHLMGDYLFARSPEPGPHFRSWEETFTARELDEHWRMIVGEAARIRRARKG
jgi:hypothetical protein